MSDGTLLLTGFGPFGQHSVNPSWEIVRAFDKSEIGSLVCTSNLLPVVYSSVSEMIPNLWKTTPNVKLCVHCGVGTRGAFCLEQRGRNSEFVRLDINGTHPSNKKCLEDGADTLFTSINVPEVIARVVEKYPNLAIKPSDDAGLYLCEFSFYLSMATGSAPVLFLHVPPVGSPYTLEEMIEYVREILTQIVACTLQTPTPVAVTL